MSGGDQHGGARGFVVRDLRHSQKFSCLSELQQFCSTRDSRSLSLRRLRLSAVRRGLIARDDNLRLVCHDRCASNVPPSNPHPVAIVADAVGARSLQAFRRRQWLRALLRSGKHWFFGSPHG